MSRIMSRTPLKNKILTRIDVGVPFLLCISFFSPLFLFIVCISMIVSVLECRKDDLAENFVKEEKLTYEKTRSAHS